MTGGVILQRRGGHSQLSTAKSGSTVRLGVWRYLTGITQKAAPNGKIGATDVCGWCQPDEAMMTTELLDDCGEHPAFGALLGDGSGVERDRGTRFVVVYDLTPSVMDRAVASRMQSLCAFEN
jgi:hypothetical protein